MKILGFEIIVRRVRKVVPPAPQEQLFTAVEQVNKAWAACRDARNMLAPWIMWSDKEVVVTAFDRTVVANPGHP